MSLNQVWTDIYMQPENANRPMVRSIQDQGGIVFTSNKYEEVQKFLNKNKCPAGMVYLVYRNNQLILEKR